MGHVITHQSLKPIRVTFHCLAKKDLELVLHQSLFASLSPLCLGLDETQKLLKELTNKKPLQVPNIYHHLPHLLNNEGSLHPAVQVGLGRTGGENTHTHSLQSKCDWKDCCFFFFFFLPEFEYLSYTDTLYLITPGKKLCIYKFSLGNKFTWNLSSGLRLICLFAVLTIVYVKRSLLYKLSYFLAWSERDSPFCFWISILLFCDVFKCLSVVPLPFF